MIKSVDIRVWGWDANANSCFEIHCINMKEGLRLLSLLKGAHLSRAIRYTNGTTVIQNYNSNGYDGITYFGTGAKHWHINKGGYYS